MYQFLTGPALWASFAIFFIGIIVEVISLLALARKKDKVVFNHLSLNWSLNSIIHWMIPFGSRSMREKPVFTLISYFFHVCLLVTPIFLLAHNLILKERWGVISYWILPENVADLMTIGVMATGVFVILRRIALPDVRIITRPYDFLVLAISIMPFITGFLAYHQVPAYRFWLIVHIISGEVMLIAIPFTRLNHIVLFFLTRSHIGSEFGKRRGAVTW